MLGCDAASAREVDTSSHTFDRLPSEGASALDELCSLGSDAGVQEWTSPAQNRNSNPNPNPNRDPNPNPNPNPEPNPEPNQEWMTKTGLIVMPPDMSLRDAGLLLRAASVTGAPVIEDGRLVGVVSRNDLLTGLLSIPLDAKQEEFEAEIARLQAP